MSKSTVDNISLEDKIRKLILKDSNGVYWDVKINSRELEQWATESEQLLVAKEREGMLTGAQMLQSGIVAVMNLARKELITKEAIENFDLGKSFNLNSTKKP